VSGSNGAQRFSVAANAQSLVQELLQARQELIEYLAIDHDPPLPERDELMLSSLGSVLHGLAMPIAMQVQSQQRKIEVPRPIIRGIGGH